MILSKKILYPEYLKVNYKVSSLKLPKTIPCVNLFTMSPATLLLLFCLWLLISLDVK